MGLFIGDICSDVTNFTLDNALLEEDRPRTKEDLKRIWGVVFDPEGKETTGRRLFAAQGLEFIPSCKLITANNSTTTVSTSANLNAIVTNGKDDFRALGTDSPFDIKQVYCSSGKLMTQTIKPKTTINDSETWIYKEYMSYTMKEQAGTARTDYNMFIRFPRFYYCRPQKWEFLVSDKYLPGFLPSPMHYVDGHMYKYAYVSKYLLNYTANTGTGNVASLYGGATSTNITVAKLQEDVAQYFKNLYTNTSVLNTATNFSGIYNTRYITPTKSCMPLNYQSLCMIYFLMYIKYATMSPLTWDTNGRALCYSGDAKVTNSQGNAIQKTIAAISDACGGANLRKSLHHIDILQSNTDKTLACYDGFIYEGNTVQSAACYMTMGLAGLIGERLLLSGAYTESDQIKSYDLIRYYSSNKSIYDPYNTNPINKNNQTDSFSNFQITNKTDDPIPVSSLVPTGIGYSKNAPWAIFPTYESSKNTIANRNFYLGKNGNYSRNQFQMKVNLSGDSLIYLAYMGLLPNLSNNTFGKTSNSESIITITNGGVRGYIVQDT